MEYIFGLIGFIFFLLLVFYQWGKVRK